MSSSPPILLAAGGTGGHLFPAVAVAEELGRRAWSVHLITDKRARDFAGDDSFAAIHVVASATIGSRKPAAILGSIGTLAKGVVQSRMVLRKIAPAVIVGFGGYPTLPPLIAARMARLPVILHEQNAVMGRANRLAARFADKIAFGFTPGHTGGADQRIEVTGNPVRNQVLVARDSAYGMRDVDQPFNLLVFGGSQGASYFAEIVPKALALMTPGERTKLRLVLQARPEDVADTVAALENLGLDAEIRPFFDDMAARIANAHLVVSRAGASTVSELSVIGRPALLVPYPYALDHDQAANAAALASSGGASVVQQSELPEKRLAEFLGDAIRQPERLAQQAQNAKKTGRLDAAARVADLVENLVWEKPK